MGATTSLDGTDVHSIVRRSWAAGLGHEGFTDDDHFFSVGGTSLSALKVMSTIGAAVGKKLSIRLLFDNQTVKELEDAVSSALAAAKP